MLFKININEGYLNKIIKYLEEVNNNEENEIIEESINKIKSLSMTDILNSINVIQDGIYETNLSSDLISNLCNIKLEKFGHLGLKDEYGMADNYEQLLKYYPELLNGDKKHIVLTEWLYRDDENRDSGFRYHKNGPYLGEKEIRSEYFNNDTHIDKILLFNILEVIEEDVKIDDYGFDFVELCNIKKK